MIKKIDITDPQTAENVLEIQIPSYMVEAELINFYDIPPLLDTVESLQHCGETFSGYFLKRELCGAISIKEENDLIDIHRLMVHPNHFRKGIANALLKYVESNARQGATMIVSTGSNNIPAIKFYQHNGFIKTVETIAADGLSLTSFQKKL